jgi:hypothetical protein
MGPLGSVIPVALEVFQAGDVRHVRHRQGAQGGDDEPRRDDVAGVRANLPAVRILVEGGPGYARTQLDIPVQVEPLGHVLEVAQHLLLLRVAFAPLPFLAKLLRERVAVDPTRRIAARARVAVPVPRTANAVASLEDPRREAHLVAQAVERVQPREPRANDDCIEFLDPLFGAGLLPVLLRARHPFPSIANLCALCMCALYLCHRPADAKRQGSGGSYFPRILPDRAARLAT